MAKMYLMSKKVDNLLVKLYKIQAKYLKKVAKT